MKNLSKSILLVFALLFVISSCQNGSKILDPNPTSLASNSKKSVLSLNLDTKFNLSKEVYEEFIGSLTFENDQFVGAIYVEVEKELDDKSSDKFWSNFGFSIRNQENYENRGRVEGGPVQIFEGYKPKRGSCKANNRWVCVIRGR